MGTSTGQPPPAVVLVGALGHWRGLVGAFAKTAAIGVFGLAAVEEALEDDENQIQLENDLLALIASI